MLDSYYDIMHPRLTEKNFIMFAMKHYENPQCLNIDEFHNDLKRIKYIKRLLSRYASHGDLKDRLILNHIIILYNSFGLEATKMLFFKIEKQYWSHLKTFLVYLNYMPEVLYGVDDVPVININIPLDQGIINALRSS